MIKHPEDHEILDWFAQGGSKADLAFTNLVKKYGDSLYRQIFLITKNHEHTNDVLQDVMIKVYRNLSGFNGDSALYTWLYRICRNESLNFIAREKRRSEVDISLPAIELLAGHGALDQHNAEFIEQILFEAIDSLPEKQALIFRLKYFEDLKYQEISDKLGTSEGALKANFHHARQKIEEFVIKRLNQI